MAYFDTYKIFHYLNKNYEDENENSENKYEFNLNVNNKLLSDLEFDSFSDTDTNNLNGGNLDLNSENTIHEEYTDLLLPKLVKDYSSITDKSTNEEIEHDINNTIEQNMSLKTLEEIYGKRNEDSNNSDSEDIYDNLDSVLGGNDRELDFGDSDDNDEDDNEDDEDEENEDEELNYYFDDIEAIEDNDIQKDIKEFELNSINDKNHDQNEIDNIYSNAIDISDEESNNSENENEDENNENENENEDENNENENENEDENNENEKIKDEDEDENKNSKENEKIDDEDENENNKNEDEKSENNEVQEGGESINKIIENLGDNDEQSYIKGCKSSKLTGGYTQVKSSKFGFYPYK